MQGVFSSRPIKKIYTFFAKFILVISKNIYIYKTKFLSIVNLIIYAVYSLYLTHYFTNSVTERSVCIRFHFLERKGRDHRPSHSGDGTY